jgi:hypothetical protein
MDGILGYIHSLFGKKPTSIFLGLAILVYLLFLFEQYTGHFRLTRIEKVTSIAESPVIVETKAAMQQQASRLTKSYVSQSKNHSPWLLRVLGGAIPFFAIALLELSKKNYWNSLRIAGIGAGFGGIISLLPDFIPNLVWCAITSTAFIYLLATFAIEDFGHPDSNI